MSYPGYPSIGAGGHGGGGGFHGGGGGFHGGGGRVVNVDRGGFGGGGYYPWEYWPYNYYVPVVKASTQAYAAWQQAVAANASPLLIAQLKARFEALYFAGM